MCLRYLDLCYVCDHITKVTCCGFIIKISNSVDGDDGDDGDDGVWEGT